MSTTTPSSKRPLSATEPSCPPSDLFLPADLSLEPTPKRVRTAQPSGIPGIADVPVDEAQRDAFFDVTQNLLAAGAVPLEIALQEVHQREQDEARDVVMGNSGSVPVKDDDDEQTKTDSADGSGSGEMYVDSVPALDPAVAAAVSTEPVDERVASPSRYLCTFWRENVTKWHSPKYELGQAASGAQLYSCDLHLHFPPAATRTFTVPADFATKREAKDAVSKLAMKHGVLEQGAAARALAGDEPLEFGLAAEDGLETLDNPMGVLHQAYQKFMPVDMFTFEYSNEPLNNRHGATLTIPVSVALTKVYTVEPTFQSRREAKEHITRLALRDGVPALFEAAFKERLHVDTGGYISFNGGEGEVALDPVAVLGKDTASILGTQKALNYITTAKDADAADSKTTHGCRLDVVVSKSLTRTFVVEPTHRSKRDAKIAVASKALKEGIVQLMRDAKRTGQATLDEKRLIGPCPPVGTVRDDELATMDNAIAYINSCFQKWTSAATPLVYEFEQDAQTNKLAGKLTCVVASGETKTYLTPFEHAGKKQAKEAVVRLAFAEGVLDLIKPKFPTPTFAGRGRGADRGRGGMRGAPRGGFGGPMGRGGFNGPPPGQQGFGHRGGYGFGAPNPGFNNRPPLPMNNFNQPQPQFYPHQLQQQYGGPPVIPYGGPQNQFGGSPAPFSADPVQQFDDFCVDWMGPGHLPAYEVRQHPQTGLFAAVVRLSVTPVNTKAYWVDHDFPTRGDAQEAVARIAIQDGVLDAVRRELPRFVPSQPYGYQQPQFPPNAFNVNNRGPLQNGTFGVPYQQALQQRGPPPPPFRSGGGPGPRANGHMNGNGYANGKSSPRPPAPKPVTAVAKPATPPVKAAAIEVETTKVAPGEPKSSGIIHQAVQVAFGTVSTEKGPATLTTSIGPESTASFSTPSIHTSKTKAKDAVADLALAANVVQDLQATVPPRPTKVSASLVDAPPPPLPPAAFKVASSPQDSPATSSAPVQIAPDVVVPSPPAPRSRPSSASSTHPSTKPRKTASALLQEYCKQNNLGLPQFTSETIKTDEGETVVQRLWVVVDELKFELPHPREKDGKERLAARVLKHYQREKDKAAATASGGS